jgi:hypothetical protein
MMPWQKRLILGHTVPIKSPRQSLTHVKDLLRMPIARRAVFHYLDGSYMPVVDKNTENYKVNQLGGELALVEAALRQIVPADLEERILAEIPKWFLLMDMFKKLEIPYSRLANRKLVEPRYRAVLTTLMAYGENIVAGLESSSTVDLTPIKSSRELVDFNVRYLRDKYEQWFALGETTSIEDDIKFIQNARTSAT